MPASLENVCNLSQNTLVHINYDTGEENKYSHHNHSHADAVIVAPNEYFSDSVLDRGMDEDDTEGGTSYLNFNEAYGLAPNSHGQDEAGDIEETLPEAAGDPSQSFDNCNMSHDDGDPGDFFGCDYDDFSDGSYEDFSDGGCYDDFSDCL